MADRRPDDRLDARGSTAGAVRWTLRAFRGLEAHQRLAVYAAVGLLVTMFLPWYQVQSLNRKSGTVYTNSITAFGALSFVEAAIFLVSAGVVTMMLARGAGSAFHLPGGDGTIVTIAGGWSAFLLFFRVFSRPPGHGYPVGIEWGFFVAFVAAGLLMTAGLRLRAAHLQEPPLPGEDGSPAARRRRVPSVGDVDWEGGPERPARRESRPRPRRDAAPTVVDPRDPASDPTRRIVDDLEDPPDFRGGRSSPPPPTSPTRRVPRRRDGDDDRPGEQLSFED